MKNKMMTLRYNSDFENVLHDVIRENGYKTRSEAVRQCVLQYENACITSVLQENLTIIYSLFRLFSGCIAGKTDKSTLISFLREDATDRALHWLKEVAGK